jgi:hypothetical protein
MSLSKTIDVKSALAGQPPLRVGVGSQTGAWLDVKPPRSVVLDKKHELAKRLFTPLLSRELAGARVEFVDSAFLAMQEMASVDAEAGRRAAGEVYDKLYDRLLMKACVLLGQSFTLEQMTTMVEFHEANPWYQSGILEFTRTFTNDAQAIMRDTFMDLVTDALSALSLSVSEALESLTDL